MADQIPGLHGFAGKLTTAGHLRKTFGLIAREERAVRLGRRKGGGTLRASANRKKPVRSGPTEGRSIGEPLRSRNP
jgi:hypothetical protein